MLAITGSSGFIGRECLKHFAGIDVLLLKKENAFSDITKIRPQTLLHMGWYVEHGKFWNSYKNIECMLYSIELFKHFISCGGKRIVFTGTCIENDNTKSLYRSAKKFCWRFLEKSFVDVVNCRIFHIFGENEDPRKFVSTVIKSLKNNHMIKCLDSSCDYLHVSQVAEAISKIIFDNRIKGVVDICSGSSISNSSLIRKISKIMRITPQIQIIPSSKRFKGDNRIIKSLEIDLEIEKKLKNMIFTFE